MRLIERFWRGEAGSMTAFGLFIFLAAAMVAGYAIDTGNAIETLTTLQATADSAAHDALVKRQTATASAAATAAVALAQADMPSARFGTILTAQDVVFGTWDASSQSFTAGSGSKSAVQVTTQMTQGNGNALPTLLLRMAGLAHWNLAARSVFTTYYPGCLGVGFIANGEVSFQSDNSFGAGFCVLSNDYVSMNSNDSFDEGAIVEMPDLSELQLPSSGLSSDPGLSDALRQGGLDIKVLRELPDIISGIASGNSSDLPSYITNSTPVALSTKGNLSASNFTSGQLYTASCNGGQGMKFANSVTLKNVVISTNCDVTFGQGDVLQNVVIATTATDAKSFSAPSSLQIGALDASGSVPTGSAELLTLGGMDMASQLSVDGAQLVAEGDISFSAQGTGIDCASFVAGGQIIGSSNMAMGACPAGLGWDYQAPYFRMVQ